ncbi:MAG: NepR family anti-sigma factor [Pseudomonadota bacterium]
MGSDKESSESQAGVSGKSKGKSAPEWADGLRQLYDAVVDEPLPDSFKDLLDQLDGAEPSQGSDDRSDPDTAR